MRLAWAMSIHKAQGQTLIKCGVLLPEPVLTHGQLYVCASRSSSAVGLRFWLGDPVDGHGYHEDTDNGKTVPHTLNIIFPAVLSVLTTTAEQPSDTGLPLQYTTTTPLDGDAAQDIEYVDLSEMQEQSLHTALHKAYVSAPAESGSIDIAFSDHDSGSVYSDFNNRAALVGLSPSDWAEVSQRSVAAIEEFLKSEERPNTPGASSSTA